MVKFLNIICGSSPHPTYDSYLPCHLKRCKGLSVQVVVFLGIHGFRLLCIAFTNACLRRGQIHLASCKNLSQLNSKMYSLGFDAPVLYITRNTSRWPNVTNLYLCPFLGHFPGSFIGALSPMLPVSLVMGQSVSATRLGKSTGEYQIKCLQPGRCLGTRRPKKCVFVLFFL